MQLAMFDTPPAEPRRKSSSRRVGGSKKGKRGPLIRVARRPDAPTIKSDPRLSFLKPSPDSAEVEVNDRHEARGSEPPVVIEESAVELDEVGVDLEVDARAGEGGIAEGEVDLAPHPTRGKLMPPEVFTEDEVRALIAACSTRGVTGHRNRALLAVLWRTGVRISEALELRPHDVDFKGLKPRTTVLPGPRRSAAG